MSSSRHHYTVRRLHLLESDLTLGYHTASSARLLTVCERTGESATHGRR